MPVYCSAERLYGPVRQLVLGELPSAQRGEGMRALQFLSTNFLTLPNYTNLEGSQAHSSESFSPIKSFSPQS